MGGDEHSRDPVPGMRQIRGRDRRKLLRFDEAFEVACRPAPQACTGLIARIRLAIEACARDRRGMVRHAVADHGIWVAWWVKEEFSAVLGQVINLSRSGAMVVLPRCPPRRQPVWLYKEVEGTLTCARGELVGLTPAPAGCYRARFRFAAPCPTNLCQAVVCGPPDSGPQPRRSASKPGSS
jgi:hypothetical protein